MSQSASVSPDWPTRHPRRPAASHPGAAAPLAKVTGMIVTVRVRLRAAGGAKHPRLGPRSGNFAGFKGSTGHFHEKIGASFYNPNCQNPAVSCLMFFLACVYGARGRHHTAQMESWTTASVECVETCAFSPFSEAKKIQNRPKMRFEPIFSPHRCSILSRRAWCVAPAAA